MTRQRTLDRCLYSALKPRCSTLSSLSRSNQRLRELLRMLVAMELAKQAGKTLPGPGTVVAAGAAAAAEAARASARALARYQDTLIQIERVRTWQSLSCGLPLRVPRLPQIVRPQSIQAVAVKAPTPLEWRGGPQETELHTRTWDLGLESFGHCAPVDRSVGTALLSGESYLPRFRHAPRETSSARQVSRWLSF